MPKRLPPEDQQAVNNVRDNIASDGSTQALRNELLAYAPPSPHAECHCGHQGQEHDSLYGCDVCSCIEFVAMGVVTA